MAFGHKRWKHGGVTYPLSGERRSSDSLLEIADPAIYYALDLFSAVINEYVGDLLLERAALEELDFPSAVAKRIAYEPSPFLLADELEFPLFCLYRSEDNWDQHTASFDKDVSTWAWAYVLPPMTPRQIEQLNPILRSVAVVVSSFAMQSFDPNWEEGKTLREMSGIQKMLAGPVRYMDIGELIEGEPGKWWRSVQGRIFVQERNDIVPDVLDTFEGANISLPLQTPDGTIDPLVEAYSHLPPVLERIEPASGTKTGGTPFQILSDKPCFRVGTAYRVLIGDAYASNVRAVMPTKLIGVTPEHEAAPTYAADVKVIDDQDNESNVLVGAFTFTTP